MKLHFRCRKFDCQLELEAAILATLLHAIWLVGKHLGWF